MKDFDVLSLFKHYSKNRLLEFIKEYKPMLHEDGTALNASRCSATVFYDDRDIVPSTFFIEFSSFVKLNYQAIADDYSEEIPPEEPEEPDSYTTSTSAEMSDDEKDSLAQKAIEKPVASQASAKNISIDWRSFFQEVFRKKLSAYSVSNKLRDLERSGVLSEVLWDFAIAGVTDARSGKNTDREADPSNTIRKKSSDYDLFVMSLKNPPIAINYTVTIESTGKQPEDNAEVIRVASQFVPEFEKYILVNSKYYSIVSKEQKSRAVPKPTEVPVEKPEPAQQSSAPISPLK